MSQIESRKDYRRELTDRIIEALEKGTAPWQRPWNESLVQRPCNALNGKHYRGFNSIHLSLIASDRGYIDPRWCTFNQAKDNDWHIKPGEKGTRIEFWTFDKVVKRTKLDENGKPILDSKGEPVKVDVRVGLANPIARYYYVFNGQQIDGIPEHVRRNAHDWDPVEKVERILANSQARVFHDQQNRAFYNPGSDQIHLPPRDHFPDQTRYYSTVLHELGHWTGHESRLHRGFGEFFGTEKYAREELRAEIASMFLSEETGIPHDVGQHAAYVGSWVKALQDDKNEIFRASVDAEKISDYIIAFDPDIEHEQQPEPEEGNNPELEQVGAALSGPEF